MFIDKVQVRDIVDPLPEPPKRAVVQSVDEKSKIRDLGTTLSAVAHEASQAEQRIHN